jgi:PadR family transcriptional regulator PadR
MSHSRLTVLGIAGIPFTERYIGLKGLTMGHDAQLLKGTMKLLVLRLLEREPMYGYQMLQHLEKESEGYFQLGDGTLYSLLHELERERFVRGRWVEVEDRPQRRRYYHLTARGERELARRRQDWQGFSRAVNTVLEARHARA